MKIEFTDIEAFKLIETLDSLKKIIEMKMLEKLKAERERLKEEVRILQRYEKQHFEGAQRMKIRMIDYDATQNEVVLGFNKGGIDITFDLTIEELKEMLFLIQEMVDEIEDDKNE